MNALQPRLSPAKAAWLAGSGCSSAGRSLVATACPSCPLPLLSSSVAPWDEPHAVTAVLRLARRHATPRAGAFGLTPQDWPGTHRRGAAASRVSLWAANGPCPPRAGRKLQAAGHATRRVHLSVTWLIRANLHSQMRLIKMELPFHL